MRDPICTYLWAACSQWLARPRLFPQISVPQASRACASQLGRKYRTVLAHKSRRRRHWRILAGTGAGISSDNVCRPEESPKPLPEDGRFLRDTPANATAGHRVLPCIQTRPVARKADTDRGPRHDTPGGHTAHMSRPRPQICVCPTAISGRKCALSSDRPEVGQAFGRLAPKPNMCESEWPVASACPHICLSAFFQCPSSTTTCQRTSRRPLQHQHRHRLRHHDRTRFRR